MNDTTVNGFDPLQTRISSTGAPATTSSTNLPPSPDPDLIFEAELGTGGAGAVYRARQTFLNRIVAVKLLHDDGSVQAADYRQRFNREARLLASLQHPHVVTCHQAGLDPTGRPYLVMEFVSGPNLNQWIAEHGRLSVPLALGMVRDLASGLAHALAKGIIHRDVKPGNVLLSPRVDANTDPAFPWVAKLADLGLARASEPSQDLHQTMDGIAVGTPTTMAPEQFTAPSEVDHRADIYGLGCILFYVLSGKHAFNAASLAGIVDQKFNHPPPRLDSELTAVGADVRALVAAMLAIKRDDRPADYAELIRRCDVIEQRAHQLNPQRSPRALFAVAGVVGIVAIVAVLLSNGRSTPVAPSAQRPASSTPIPSAPSPLKTQAAQLPVTLPSATPVIATIPAPTAPQPLPQSWQPAEEILLGVSRGLPDWSSVGAAHSEHSDGHWLALGRGWIERDIPALPYRVVATLSRAADMPFDTVCLGFRMPNGGVIGITLQDLASQTFAQSATFDDRNRISSSLATPVVFPSPAQWVVTLTALTDRIILSVNGQTLPVMPVPAPPRRLAIGHLQAEKGKPGVIVIQSVAWSAPLPLP